MAANEFDNRWLKGITFKTAESKKGKDENGRAVTRNTPVERPAEPGDVLAWKDNGDNVGIVMKDGRKYSVAKKGGAGAGTEGEKGKADGKDKK